jgi:transcription antitermination factor NusG
VVYVVGTRSGPLPVDPEELATVRRIADLAAVAEPWPFLAEGQPVTLEHGPLRGITGVLVSIKTGWKVVVSVTLLQRSVAVEVDRAWVRPEGTGRRLAAAC